MKTAGFSGVRNSRSAVDLAPQTAQAVNEENRGNTLQQRAQKVISSITSRPGVTVSPEILYEAAQGEYYDKDYDAALDAFKAILTQLDARDEATQQEYAPKVLYHMGKSLDGMDRELEAAMAFKEGATKWAGDPEYQLKLAQGYYQAIDSVRKASSDDPYLVALYRGAENLVVDATSKQGGSAAAIQFRQAERSYVGEDFQGARAQYQAVDPSGDDYEKALAKAALCLYKVKDTDGAAKEFEAYLEYANDPTNAVTGQTKQLKRHEAMAQSTYYLGVIAKGKNDWAGIVKWLDGYHEKFPDQSSYAPRALYLVVLAHIALGDIESAKVVNAQMKEAFGAHVRTGTAAIKIYEALSQAKDAAEAAGDTSKATELKEEMAKYMHLSNELASSPAYNNLRTESSLWIELGRWADAEAALNIIVASYKDGADTAEGVETHILPDLGLALMEQQRVPEAFEVLDPLVPKDESDTRKPKSETVRRWVRSVTGWVEGDETNAVEVPGVGGADNLKLASEMILRLTSREKSIGAGDWTCPWYELKFEMAYTYYQWGKEDSNKTETAVDIIRQLRDFLGDPNLDQIATDCGDNVLRRRYRWLWDQVQ